MIFSDFQKYESSPLQQYFCFTETQITLYDCHPVPFRGALAIVTNVGRGAVDADAATDARSLSVRRSRVVLAPEAGAKRLRNKFLRGDGGKRARLTGEITYKP